MSRKIASCVGLALVLSAWVGAAESTPYDPLSKNSSFTPETIDFDVHDARRKRTIPIRIYLPETDKPAPVVLFSHGLGGSRENCAYLGVHWSARGYTCIFLQHPGSDLSVWADLPRQDRLKALEAAANLENFRLRAADVPAVLDQLALWNADGEHNLAGRLNLERVGMVGHSFGAVTTQAVSGQTFPMNVSFAEPRIDAAVAFSPSAPRRGEPAKAFGSVGIPWLLMTGTRDTSMIGGADVASRRAVYPALPPGGKYELVLFDAEHSAFGDRALPGERGDRNPNHHRAILALSSAFWDAYLRGDEAARAWLDGDGPRSILEDADVWQRK